MSTQRQILLNLPTRSTHRSDGLLRRASVHTLAVMIAATMACGSQTSTNDEPVIGFTPIPTGVDSSTPVGPMPTPNLGDSGTPMGRADAGAENPMPVQTMDASTRDATTAPIPNDPAADSGFFVDASNDGGPTGQGGPMGDGGPTEKDAGMVPPQCDKVPPPSMDCGAPLAPGDRRRCTMRVAGRDRYYYLYAPKNYNPCKPAALIIDCHGAMEAAEIQAGIKKDHKAGDLDFPGIGSGWQLESETDGGGFLVATPAGIDEIWTTSNSDPEFFIQILEATKKAANIDPAKVYMTGISNGSIISFATVCAHSDLFAGIAAFSAGQTCRSIGRPVPVISFDAAPDFAYTTTVNATNAMVSLNGCTSTPDPKWMVIDKTTTDTICRDEPFSTDPKLVPCNTITKTSETTDGIKPTVCKRWSGCKNDVAVVFCDVAPATRHGPSNAAVDAHILYSNASSLNMPSVAWRFFKSFWK